MNAREARTGFLMVAAVLAGLGSIANADIGSKHEGRQQEQVSVLDGQEDEPQDQAQQDQQSQDQQGPERVAKTHFRMMRRLTVSTPSGYTPAQIRKAYGFSSLSQDGTGQTIAIVDAYGSPTAQNDLNYFSRQFSLPATTLQIAYPQGKPRAADTGWALETSLDVQWAHAIAPKAKILLVVAKNASFDNLLAAVDYASAHASQVSMSWGANDFSDELNWDYHFNKPGVSFTAASGDSGTGTIWPATSPYVISIGGTTLSLDASGKVLSETAWSGSGGGVSPYEPEPSYQLPWQNSGFRSNPDFSLNADPNTGFAVYDSTAFQRQKGWFVVGGTSAGAPQAAAMIALANQARSGSVVGSLQAFYSFAGTPSSLSGNFRDVTSGCNSSNSSALTCAQAGYDDVTGFGSALASRLVPLLISY